MICRVSPRSGISLATSCASLPSPNPKTLPSLRRSEFASVRAVFSVSSKQGFDSHSSRKELQVKCSAKFKSKRLISEFSKRVVRRAAGASGHRLSTAMSSMPTAVGFTSIYPIKGLFFFFNKENRALLLQRVGKFAAEVGAASLAILGAIAGFTFHAQRGVVLQVVPHFFGTPGTVILILVETAIPVVLLFNKRLHRVQDKLFQDVINMQKIQVQRASPDEREWIDEQREIQRQERQVAGRPSVYKAVKDPTTLNNHPIMKYFITLPLNFIPVVGTAAFCWLNAMDTSTLLHHHYYSDLKGLSSDEEATIVHARRSQYQQFGMMASLLTVLPGFNVILVLTNSVGAALWAADIERALQKHR